MRRLTTFLAALVLAALAWVGARGAGPLPPLGPLLDPVHGVWAAARAAALPRDATADVPGLSAPVRVVYDDRAVPHIFAATEGDAVRALGYVVARDRLFQMELQTRAASGRLT
ncbi:MAG TPA: penicillin acylase family protein, partial [Gemmatimonadaceae bacterium]|nr:penicillin acylase family protein [Gemmatimonadaceae bacterium]